MWNNVSACIHDTNEIPTATPTLSRSCIMTALVRILSYVRVSSISKMAAYNWISAFRLQAAIFDFSLTYTAVFRLVLPDRENIDIAVGILLLSCVQAELYVISGFDSSRNSPKRNGKFRRTTEIFRKNEGGCNFAPRPHSSRVNSYD